MREGRPTPESSSKLSMQYHDMYTTYELVGQVLSLSKMSRAMSQKVSRKKCHGQKAVTRYCSAGSKQTFFIQQTPRDTGSRVSTCDLWRLKSFPSVPAHCIHDDTLLGMTTVCVDRVLLASAIAAQRG